MEVSSGGGNVKGKAEEG